jgi:hypothetical protein
MKNISRSGIGWTISARMNLLSICLPKCPLTIKLLTDMISIPFIWMSIVEERRIAIVFMVAFLEKSIHTVLYCSTFLRKGRGEEPRCNTNKDGSNKCLNDRQ